MKRILSVFIAVLAVVQLSLCTPAASAAPYEDARSSIIRILTKWGDDYMTTGTGFFIGEEGDSVQYIVTNSHVIHFVDSGYIYDPSSLEVIFDGIDNQTTLEATVVKDWKYWEDGQPDLAIIKLVAETTLRKSIPLMPASQLGLTETIYALGFPYIADYDTLNLPSRVEDVTVSKGSVTKQLYQGINGDVRYFQMDAVISGGNSGGPVITEEGYAAGISSYSSTETAGFNYALYMDYIIDFLDTMGIPYDKVEDRSAGASGTGGTDVGPTGAAGGTDVGPTGGTDVVPTIAPSTPPASESKGLFGSLPGWALIAVICVLGAVVIAVILLLVLSKKKPAPPPPMPAQPMMPPPPVQRTIPVAPASQPAPSGPAIIGIAGEMNGKTFPVSGAIAIGRDSARCAVAYAASTPGISSEHCRLKAVQNGVVLVDVGSTYGTFFENGSKLTAHQEYTLHSGDKFYLGSKDNGFRVV